MIVAGFGFTGAATEASLEDALRRAQDQLGTRAEALATLTDKAQSPAWSALMQRTPLSVSLVAQTAAQAQTTLTQSDAAQAAHGLGSVAEAAALAAAGNGARLLGARVVSEDRQATCALAQGGSR